MNLLIQKLDGETRREAEKRREDLIKGASHMGVCVVESLGVKKIAESIIPEYLFNRFSVFIGDRSYVRKHFIESLQVAYGITKDLDDSIRRVSSLFRLTDTNERGIAQDEGDGSSYKPVRPVNKTGVNQPQFDSLNSTTNNTQISNQTLSPSNHSRTPSNQNLNQTRILNNQTLSKEEEKNLYKRAEEGDPDAETQVGDLSYTYYIYELKSDSYSQFNQMAHYNNAIKYLSSAYKNATNPIQREGRALKIWCLHSVGDFINQTKAKKWRSKLKREPSKEGCFHL